MKQHYIFKLKILPKLYSQRAISSMGFMLFIIAGCAINDTGFVSVGRYKNETARLIELKVWGVHLLTNSDDAYSVVKQMPLQYFAKQVVSIEQDVQSRDIYAIKLRLHAVDGSITEQQFSFFVGVPFALVLVAISVLLLLFISFVFLKQLRKE